MATTDLSDLPGSDRPSTSVREGVAIGILLLSLAIVGVWWVLSPVEKVAAKPPTDPDYLNYLGDAACASCHPSEAAAHSRSGHAQTFRRLDRSPLARKLDGRKVEDPEVAGVMWSFAFRGGKLVSERDEAGRIERSIVEYVFGSGHHAATLISLVDRAPASPRAFEQRLSYFAHTDGLGLTPGQSLEGHASGNSPGGRLHSSADTLKCFECHVTVTSDRGPKFLDELTMIPNVSCERCHGPGRSHVQAAQIGATGEALRMLEGPGRWTAAEQMTQCGACHRTPEMVQPGSIRVDNPVMVRHQPVGLMQSACYLKSNGKLSCVTCHNPHAKTSTNPLEYEASCLSCHQQPATEKLCTVSPSTGCLDCHMPKRDVARGMTMTDHWIRRKP